MSKQTISNKSNVIRNETEKGRNTGARIANVIDDINDSKLDVVDGGIVVQKIIATNLPAADGSFTKQLVQKADGTIGIEDKSIGEVSTLQSVLENGNEAFGTNENNLIKADPNSEFSVYIQNQNNGEAASIVLTPESLSLQKTWENSDLATGFMIEKGGINYLEDYSQRPEFGDRTLVDRGYVDRTVDNVVMKTGDQFIEGVKTFNEPLVIANAVDNDQAVSLGQVGTILEDVNLQKVLDTGNYAESSDGTSQFTMDLNNKTFSSAQSNPNTGDQTFVQQNPTELILGRNFSATETTKMVKLEEGGLNYSDDFSADYTARTLVDKGYVDSVKSAINLQSVLNNGTYAQSADANKSIDLNVEGGSFDISFNNGEEESTNIHQTSNSLALGHYFPDDIISYITLEKGGLQYENDYSQRSEFNDRNLVDKGYVDKQATLQKVLNNNGFAQDEEANNTFALDLYNRYFSFNVSDGVYSSALSGNPEDGINLGSTSGNNYTTVDVLNTYFRVTTTDGVNNSEAYFSQMIYFKSFALDKTASFIIDNARQEVITKFESASGEVSIKQTSEGLKSATDFSANPSNLDFVQRKFVENLKKILNLPNGNGDATYTRQLVQKADGTIGYESKTSNEYNRKRTLTGTLEEGSMFYRVIGNQVFLTFLNAKITILSNSSNVIRLSEDRFDQSESIKRFKNYGQSTWVDIIVESGYNTDYVSFINRTGSNQTIVVNETLVFSKNAT